LVIFIVDVRSPTELLYNSLIINKLAFKVFELGMFNLKKERRDKAKLSENLVGERVPKIPPWIDV